MIASKSFGYMPGMEHRLGSYLHCWIGFMNCSCSGQSALPIQDYEVDRSATARRLHTVGV